MSSSFKCATCGQEHSGLPFDYSFGLPDEVFELDFLSRYQRTRSNSDLCTLDGSRFFIRGLIPLPFLDSTDEFGWGIWVEVSRGDHDKYLGGYYEDLSGEPRFSGKLACSIPGYSETLGIDVEIAFGAKGQRPSFHVAASLPHALADDQHKGLTPARHHELLEAVGHFKRHTA